MPSIQNFKDLAALRLEEVKLLYGAGYYAGAMYMSGYIIEYGLKARICKVLDIDFPETGETGKLYKTHDFDRLITLAGLRKQLDLKRNEPSDFNKNWSLVTAWSESLRYEIGGVTKADVEEILQAIEDNNDGILTWIKTIW